MAISGRRAGAKGGIPEPGFCRKAQDAAGMVSDALPNGLSMADEDFGRFLEMLERSNPQAFRELMERDRGWA